MIEQRITEVLALPKTTVKIHGVVPFNHKATIDRINLYDNSMYLEAGTDKLFWNISASRKVHFAKNLDFDTKDLLPYGELDYVKAFVTREKCRAVYDNIELGNTINDILSDVATYGSAVVKVIGKGENVEIERVDISNLSLDPTAKTIRETDVVETHMMTRDDLKKQKKKGWDIEKIDHILSSNKNADVYQFDIHEYWGWAVDDDGNTEYHHAYSIGDENEGEVLVFDRIVSESTSPYYDYHVTEYKGRWLRVGVIERLFDVQVRVNKLFNFNDQATEIATLLIFRSSEGENQGNVFEHLANGDIVNSNDLQQVGISQTAFNNFIAELKVLEDKADQLCFTPEVVSGETMPSGTPFRGQVLTADMALSSFTQAKQNIGESFGVMIKVNVIKPMVKNWNASDFYQLVEDERDIDIYNQALVNKLIRDKLLEGVVITPEVRAEIEAEIENQPDSFQRFVYGKKGFFDFDFDIKLNVTGEKVNKGQMNDAYNNAITWTLQNPEVVNLPLFRQYLENNNISWWKLTQKQVEAIQESATGMQMPQQPTSDINNLAQM